MSDGKLYTKKAMVPPGYVFHTWQQGAKQPNGSIKFRCVVCDFIAYAKAPHTPDPDPRRPCPAKRI